MIKKAVKRPDEVEYIEFKGRENFKEVCEFIGNNEKLVEDINGNEHLLISRYHDFENVNIPVGAIFYRWYDLELDCNPWEIKDKYEFFKCYKDEITTKEFANIISESRSKMAEHNGGEQ